MGFRHHLKKTVYHLVLGRSRKTSANAHLRSGVGGAQSVARIMPSYGEGDEAVEVRMFRSRSGKVATFRENRVRVKYWNGLMI